MKRKREDEVDNTSNKKPRKNIANDIFDDESLSNCFCNVNNLANAVGYFTGKVDMVWSHIPDKLMWSFIASCCISDKKHKISVSLEGDWVQHLKESGWVAIMDDLQLSLDGVGSAQSKGSKAAAKLIYKEGIIFRRTRRGESCFLNTWQLQQPESVGKEDDWFATPDIPFPNRISDLVRRISSGRPSDTLPKEEDTKMEVVEKTPSGSSASLVPHNERTNESRRSPLPKKESPPLVDSRIKRESPAVATSAQVKHDEQKYATLQPQSITLQMPQVSPPKSRREAKKERKRKRAAQLAAAAAVISAAEQASVQNPPRNTAAEPATAGSSSNHAGSATGLAVIDLGRIGAAKIDENTPEGWLAQLHYSQPQHLYSTLKEVLKLKIGNSFNVIGVVKGRRMPYKTKNGDWSTTIHLQDPTSFEDPNYPPTDFSVVFFQKDYEEWLPQASVGDILILRNIKVQNHNGFSGVGYKGKMQWATFSIVKECLLQPDIGQAPESGELVGGGLRFSPFLKGLEHEERYCKRFAEWWKERNSPSSEATGQVYQLIDHTSRRLREHRLFCDAGPQMEPDGYFDCTFEVLNGFENENGVFTLYVTDYTKNAQAASCQAPWCPVGLNEYVLLFNLWDEAAARGRGFKPKTYWAVRNARMVCGNNGFVEGKLVQNKFSEVGSDDDYPPLRALLERKKIWEKGNSQNLPSFPHKLFKDVRAKEFFNCTVELLHIVNKGPDRVHLFVTDYTEHPEFSHPCKEEWSQGLEGRVVCIQLRDNQVQNANSLKGNDGKFLAIKNLRLMSTGDGRTLQGELGGYDLLLNLLQNESPSEDLQELRMRKDKWQREKERKLHSQAREPRAPQVAPSTNMKIGQLEATTKDCLKARVIARVIDYYPRSPGDWVGLWCCQCKQRIPKENRACRNCQDIDHEFVRSKFELVLLIEDKMGDRTELILRNESDLLQGIDIGDNVLDPSIFGELSKRLEPLLGTLNEKEDVANRLDHSSAFSPLIVGQFELHDLGPIRLLINIED